MGAQAVCLVEGSSQHHQYYHRAVIICGGIFILMFSVILSEELSRGNSLEVFQLGMSGAGMLGRVYCDDYGGSCGGIFGVNVAMVTY